MWSYKRDMTEAAEKLLSELMKLPWDEREILALKALEPANDEVESGNEEAWQDEIARRRESVKNGEAKLYTWEEVEAAKLAPAPNE